MTDTRYITALRFPLACFVVLIHAHNTCWRNLGSHFIDDLGTFLSLTLPLFAVPLFFVISGYLFFFSTQEHGFTAHTYATKMKHRLRTLLVPYLAWNILAVALYSAQAIATGQSLQQPLSANLLWGCRTTGVGFTNWLGMAVAPGTAPVHEVLWFVRDLIVVTLLSPLFYALLKRGGAWALLALAVVYYAQLWQNPLGVTFNAFWWFAVGAFFAIRGLSMSRLALRVATPAAVIVIPAAAATTLCSSALATAARHIYVLCAIITAISIATWFAKRHTASPTLAKSSFFVYAAHTIFLLPLTKLFASLSAATHSCAMEACCFITPPILAAALSVSTFYILHKFIPRLSSPLTAIVKN